MAEPPPPINADFAVRAFIGLWALAFVLGAGDALRDGKGGQFLAFLVAAIAVSIFDIYYLAFKRSVLKSKMLAEIIVGIGITLAVLGCTLLWQRHHLTDQDVEATHAITPYEKDSKLQAIDAHLNFLQTGLPSAIGDGQKFSWPWQAFAGQYTDQEYEMGLTEYADAMMRLIFELSSLKQKYPQYPELIPSEGIVERFSKLQHDAMALRDTYREVAQHLPRTATQQEFEQQAQIGSQALGFQNEVVNAVQWKIKTLDRLVLERRETAAGT